MAKMIQKHTTSTYKSYYYKGIAKISLCILIAIIGLLLIKITKGVSLLLFISLIFIKPEMKHFEVMSVGLKGERITDDILVHLPNRYNVLSDVVIYKKGGKNQLDHVVIGKNGIFVVETKFYSGLVKGSDKDVKILQVKRDHTGKAYHRRFLNPTLQVETHIRAIERVLEHHGYYDIPVVGMVFFSNINAKVKVRSKRMKIFSMAKRGRVKLLRHIKWHRTSNRLSKYDIKNITQLLLDKG